MHPQAAGDDYQGIAGHMKIYLIKVLLGAAKPPAAPLSASAPAA